MMWRHAFYYVFHHIVLLQSPSSASSMASLESPKPTTKQTESVYQEATLRSNFGRSVTTSTDSFIFFLDELLRKQKEKLDYIRETVIVTTNMMHTGPNTTLAYSVINRGSKINLQFLLTLSSLILRNFV